MSVVWGSEAVAYGAGLGRDHVVRTRVGNGRFWT